MGFSISIQPAITQAVATIQAQLPGRAGEAANELKKASVQVLRGQGGGEKYRAPTGGMHTASAPGSPPAVRTGTLRDSWRPAVHGINPAIESNTPYAGYLEDGTRKMAARPYEQKIVDMAKPAIDAIYQKPFV